MNTVVLPGLEDRKGDILPWTVEVSSHLIIANFWTPKWKSSLVTRQMIYRWDREKIFSQSGRQRNKILMLHPRRIFIRLKLCMFKLFITYFGCCVGYPK